jgi:hypothetical protein
LGSGLVAVRRSTRKGENMPDKVKKIEGFVSEITDRMYGIIDNIKSDQFDWAMIGVDEAQEILDNLREAVEEEYDAS